MAVISKIWGLRENLTDNCGIDPLVLTSEERARAHFVAETASGRQVRISMDRGTELQDGDVLYIDGNWAITVSAAEEDLLYLRPGSDAIIWWATCYQLGNLHRPARFVADGVLTPFDPMALQLLQGLGTQVERVRKPFVGRRFGAADHHQHSHDHKRYDHPGGSGHGHVHPHEHEHPHTESSSEGGAQ